MNCWCCGAEIRGNRRVVGRSPEQVVCERCILEPHAESGGTLLGARCVFCGEDLGRPRGWFRRRPALRVGIQRHRQVMCEECLQLMKDIAAGWG